MKRRVIAGLCVATAATILFGGATVATADYATTVIDDGARGYWQLNDQRGSK